MYKCIKCGESFERLSNGGRKRISCFACSPSHKRQHPQEYKNCKVCGERFLAEQYRQLCCSDRCQYQARITSVRAYRKKYYKKAQPREKECKGCHKIFLGVGQRKYCSRECYERSTRRTRFSQSLPAIRICLHCGSKFSPHWLSQIYCRDKCAKAHARANYLKRDWLRIRKREALARQKHNQKVRIAFAILNKLGVQL